MPNSENKPLRPERLSFVFGGLACLVGLAFVASRGCGRATHSGTDSSSTAVSPTDPAAASPSPVTLASSSASGSASAKLGSQFERDTDLGPELGSPWLRGNGDDGKEAHSLALSDDGVAWLQADQSGLYLAKWHPAKAEHIMMPKGNEALAENLVTTADAIWFTAKGEDDAEGGPSPSEAPAARPGGVYRYSQGAISRVAEADSPDHLSVRESDAVWGDLGRVVRHRGGNIEVLAKDRERIAGLAIANDHIVWLEEPYTSTERRTATLYAMRGDVIEKTGSLPALRRDSIQSVGGYLLWVRHLDDGRHQLMATDQKGAAQQLFEIVDALAITGFLTPAAKGSGPVLVLVWSALTPDEKGHSVWSSKAVGSDAGAWTASPPKRLGRVNDHIVSLSTNGARVVASGEQGLWQWSLGPGDVR